MKREDRHSYLAIGLTAFAVISASLCLFFLLFHMKEVTGFLSTIGGILRPIFMGAVIAFLLLPVHRNILIFLLAMTSDRRKEDRRNLAFLNLMAIIFSLALAVFLIYLLLAMVIPQVYESIVGLILSRAGSRPSSRTIRTFRPRSCPSTTPRPPLWSNG